MVVYEGEQICILYGSETGQSQGIAEEIFSMISQKSIRCSLFSMEEAYQKNVLDELRCVVFVTSSTGDGDPPDNAMKFFKQLKACESLKNICFTLLGLGDSNYTTFLGFPKALKKVLEEKGAHMFYPAGWADDAVGLEIVVDPWIEGLLPALQNYIDRNEISNGASADAKEEPVRLEPHRTEAESTEKVAENAEIRNGLPTPPAPHTVSDAASSGPSADRSETNVLFDSLNLEIELKETEKQRLPTLSFSPALSESTIRMPALPRAKFQMQFLEEDVKAKFEPTKVRFLPSAAGPVVNLAVKTVRRLTTPDADKCALEITLDKEGNDLDCEPGDSIGIICPNDPEEVDTILARLGMREQADKLIQFLGDVKDIPSHFPEKSSLRSLLLYYCDIRNSPKKLLLRVLEQHAGDESEKRRLQELCSIEGASEYTEFVKEAIVSFLDVLETFPSSKPPVDRVLEQLPKLLPRAYSIVTSKLKDPDHLAFVFKIVEFPIERGRTRERKGVATGWMSSLTSHFWIPESIDAKLKHLSLEPIRLPVYPRTNTTFRLPPDLATPIIMVGPGSGVAPFVGFLHHREELIKKHPVGVVGASWLFFGCRHEKRDFLYRAELERLHNNGVLTRFYAAFSKEPSGGPRYVQDYLKVHSRPIVNLLVEKGAVFYVCGDAKGMSRDVFEAVANAISTVKGIELVEARATLARLQVEKRYLQDVWS